MNHILTPRSVLFNPARITAIVPAYNEEGNIAEVLRVLKKSLELSDIIVVDDGSTDRTAEGAQQEGVRVIRQKNQGKAGAMATGAAHTDADILFFADADLVGLTPGHVTALVEPVIAGGVGMTVGIRDRGVLATWMMENVLPVIGGERALPRDIFLQIVQHHSSKRFGIETIMNAYCKKKRIPVRLVRMEGLTHIIKEVRYGFWRGIIARMRMVREIFIAEMATLFDRI